MDCARAEQLILASLDGVEQSDSEYREALDHASTCTRCGEIGRIHQALDAALEASILGPHLSAVFRANFTAKIAASTSNESEEWLPDVVYFLGAAAAAALFIVATSASKVTVVLLAILGLLGYVFQLVVASASDPGEPAGS